MASQSVRPWWRKATSSADVCIAVPLFAGKGWSLKYLRKVAVATMRVSRHGRSNYARVACSPAANASRQDRASGGPEQEAAALATRTNPCTDTLASRTAAAGTYVRRPWVFSQSNQPVPAPQKSCWRGDGGRQLPLNNGTKSWTKQDVALSIFCPGSSEHNH